MITIVITISIILFLKFTYNFNNYIKCKRYLKLYIDSMSDKKNGWDIIEKKSEVLSLFSNAGIKDSKLIYTENLGYGRIATSTDASLFENFPIRRKDAFELTVVKFHEAIGVYKRRMKETFSPFYWGHTFIYLPRKIFSHFGIKQESKSSKFIQFLYWIIGIIIAILLALYPTQLKKIIESIF